jgi:hypothetical protein
MTYTDRQEALRVLKKTDVSGNDSSPLTLKPAEGEDHESP